MARRDTEENERPLRRVPKSRRPVALKRRSRATKAAANKRSGDEPVKFFGYESTDGVGPKDPVKNAVDMSGADSESDVVMMSGNWFLRYSTNGGGSFTTADPTTVFPKWSDHDFCCDQIVIYAPSIDRFVWFMQHDADSAGIGAFRLAVASPADIKKNFQNAWTYWNFTAKDFGLSEDLDYPDLSYTKEFLHISTDATTTNGRLVVRVALNDLRAAGTLPGRHTHPDKSKSAVGAHLAQGSLDGAFWAGSPDNSTLQVFSWPDSSTSYSWFSATVAAYPNAALSSKGPNERTGSNGSQDTFPGSTSAAPFASAMFSGSPGPRVMAAARVAAPPSPTRTSGSRRWKSRHRASPASSRSGTTPTPSHTRR